MIFSIRKLMNYLVVPNNLLLSLSLSGAPSLTLSKTLQSYARAKSHATSINKGLGRVPFVRIFMSFSQLVQERNKKIFIH